MVPPSMESKHVVFAYAHIGAHKDDTREREVVVIDVQAAAKQQSQPHTVHGPPLQADLVGHEGKAILRPLVLEYLIHLGNLGDRPN
jgi:hypothetical protein